MILILEYLFFGGGLLNYFSKKESKAIHPVLSARAGLTPNLPLLPRFPDISSPHSKIQSPHLVDGECCTHRLGLLGDSHVSPVLRELWQVGLIGRSVSSEDMKAE